LFVVIDYRRYSNIVTLIIFNYLLNKTNLLLLLLLLLLSREVSVVLEVQMISGNENISIKKKKFNIYTSDYHFGLKVKTVGSAGVHNNSIQNKNNEY